MNKPLLRPAFTQALADTLLAGKHVNLVSPHGRGRRQTLIDLISLLDAVQVTKIDLKREQNALGKWLKHTLNLTGQVIVIIHNFDVVFSSAIKFDLERLAQQNNFTFLCVVERESQLDFLTAKNINLPI